MIYKIYILILISLLLFPFRAPSQINCTVPSPPALTSVSVQPETSKTEFSWILSESSDIAAYIIYKFIDGAGTALDTVWDPSATSYVITNTAPKYSSVSYVIAAHRLSVIPGLPGCTSPLSNVLTTIFCESTIDTCYNTLNVSWNSYPSEPYGVSGYSIMLSVNGGEFTEESVTPAGINNFTLDNFITEAEYCFYIKANLEGGRFSTSNKSCISTDMQRPPGWVNADYATVEEGNKIKLAFTVDPMSEIIDFLLEKKIGQAGTFQPLAQLRSVNGSVSFTDENADTGIINFYRLSAMNSCKIPVTVSNVCSNMVLSLKRKEDELHLSWNPYRLWLGSVSEYRLYINTGNSFEEKKIIAAEDSLVILDYSEIMYDVSEGEICFYVNAREISNPYGITGQSSSSVICTDPVELITVPNIFTPNNDLKNDLFKPVLSFTPLKYHLIISDQHGSVLFETRDFNETWDGSKNGNPLPDGLCLWFLRITTASGNSISKNGTVVILKNP